MHSIRNSIEGSIQRIITDKVMSEIVLATAAGPLVAVITTASVKALKLKKGETVSAEIKATNVSLSKCSCGKHAGPPGKGCHHE